MARAALKALGDRGEGDRVARVGATRHWGLSGTLVKAGKGPSGKKEEEEEQEE